MKAENRNIGSGIKVKICGLSRPEDIQAVNRMICDGAGHPDYIGFVFAPSRRQVSAARAWELKQQLSPDIRAVGVFVNASAHEIMDIVNRNIIDVIQLHGDEDAGMIQEIQQLCHLPVIKAIRVQREQDIRLAQNLPCDYLLLDTDAKGVYGGSGQQFDWSLIPPMKKPFFLAGGLSADLLTGAAATGAYCLDLSSSVETDGGKDPEKIAEILKKIRSINRCQKENLDNMAGNSYRKH